MTLIEKKRLAIWAGATAILLIIPLIAMQFSEEAKWGVADFILAGLMLLGTGAIYDLGIRKINSKLFRRLASIALIGAFFLTWAQLAVGIIGN